MTWQTGQYYEGNWQNDIPNGKGKFYDGNVYEGKF